ncbi:MAG: bifunctional folylpolyglutamate synthase/dihydrofolate synthase [Candidatus Marinimicrobia bacterium]|nr:bifunctional folylpolyglutamate synthase/dihydrofolate synthase [Candidatus Neomarinimicrobiota bacterium]
MRTSEYDKTLYYLFGLRTFGIHLGLEVPKLLAAKVGNPQRRYPAVHIAGTNGKGTTAALIESVLREKGLKTGLYTSPHLVNFNERIRVNGTPIEDGAIMDYADYLKDSVDKNGASFFEATTVIALKYFADMEVDIVVAEAGLGARLDTTMLVEPVISAITSINLDHTKYLGETVKEIAAEKVHVMRWGIPCIVGNNSRTVFNIFDEFARKSKSEYKKASDLCSIPNIVYGKGDVKVEARFKDRSIADLSVPLMGVHQRENIQTSLAVIDTIPDISISDEQIKRGFGEVSFRGRMEIVSEEPSVIYDVAHNPSAVKSLIESVQLHYPDRKITGLLALLKGKDYEGILNELVRRVEFLVCTEIPGHDSVSSETLADSGKALGIDTKSLPGFEEATKRGLSKLNEKSLLLIFGSHYVAEMVYDNFRLPHPYEVGA